MQVVMGTQNGMVQHITQPAGMERPSKEETQMKLTLQLNGVV